MTPQQRQTLEQLANRVAELERWKEEKQRQQISFPLDETSKTIINNL